MSRRFPLLLVVVAAAWWPATAWAAGDARIEDNRFVPVPVTIVAGEAVVWRHEGDNTHTVTADDGSFDSSPGLTCLLLCTGGLQRGDTFSATFARPGTFGYHCKVHSGMRGVVVVNPAPSPSPSPQPSPSPSPQPSPSPSPAASPSPTASPAASPTDTASPSPNGTSSPSPSESPGTPGGQRAGGDRGGGGGSGAARIALLGALVAVGSGVGLFLLRRRAGP